MQVSSGLARSVFLLVLVLSFVGVSSAAGIVVKDVQNPSTVEPTDQVRVKVTLKNEMGEEADEVEVRVKGWNRLKEETVRNMEPGEEETLTFYLYVPEGGTGTERIGIEVQALDEDGVILDDYSTSVSVTVREDTIVVEDADGDQNLEIGSVSVPSRILAGQRIGIDVTAENRGSSDAVADFRVEVFGQTVESEGVVIKSGRNRTVTLNLTVPSGASGPYDAEVTVSTYGERDITNVSINVEKLYLTMQLSPGEVEVGEPVTVSGSSNLRGISAKLYIGGFYEATLNTGKTGHYTYTFTPESSGAVRVKLVRGKVSVSKILHVNPELEIRAVSAPRTVTPLDIVKVCGEVARSDPGDVDVSLVRGGKTVKERTVPVDTSAEICLRTSFETTGTRDLRFQASAGEVTVSETVTVEVVDTGVEVGVFPESLTLKKGQAGVFQAEIRNDRLKRRSFTVKTVGFENVSTPEPVSLTLEKGGSETVSLRVIPSGLGTLEGEVVVSTGSGVVSRDRVEIVSTRSPALKGTFADWFSGVSETLRGTSRTVKYGAAAVSVIVLAVLFLAWRRRNRVMEPQY